MHAWGKSEAVKGLDELEGLEQDATMANIFAGVKKEIGNHDSVNVLPRAFGRAYSVVARELSLSAEETSGYLENFSGRFNWAKWGVVDGAESESRGYAAGIAN